MSSNDTRKTINLLETIDKETETVDEAVIGSGVYHDEDEWRETSDPQDISEIKEYLLENMTAHVMYKVWYDSRYEVPKAMVDAMGMDYADVRYDLKVDDLIRSAGYIYATATTVKDDEGTIRSNQGGKYKHKKFLGIFKRKYIKRIESINEVQNITDKMKDIFSKELNEYISSAEIGTYDSKTALGRRSMVRAIRRALVHMEEWADTTGRDLARKHVKRYLDSEPALNQ
jgi:uncharacterized protein YeeX (DUF496 family)